MYLEKNFATKWLIKAENKILGPYNYDQIIDLIRKKQISLIDEIRDPETRWLYVRENPEFKNIVEEMRKAIDSVADRTKTYQSFSKTNEELAQKTRTDVNQFTDINLETSDAVVLKEILTATPEGAVKPIMRKPIHQVKTYGSQEDGAVKTEIGHYFWKTLFSLFAVLVLIAGSFYGYIYIQKRDAVKQEEEQVWLIKKYKYLGLYQKSTEIYSRLPVPSQKKLVRELLEMYPLLEDAGLVTLEDIESFKTSPSLTSEQKANIELIYFRIAMQKNNYGDAQDFLVKATTFQPASNLIKENEALLNLKKGQFLSAFNIFSTIYKQESNGRYLLGMVQSYFGLPDADKALRGRELLSTLESYTIVHYDYKKELLLAQILLANDFNETVLYKVSKSQFFNTPCQLSNEFVKPTLLTPKSYAWAELAEISTSVQKKLNGDELILFQLHNNLELNQLSRAAEFNSNNLAKLNSGAVRAQMSLLLFNAQKRNNEILALEKSNKLDMSSELNHFLIAKNKIEMNPGEDIATHLNFLGSRQFIFYKDWLLLERLINTNSLAELKIFINDHFLTVPNFNPVFIAKSLVN